ncbi:ceramide kinase 1-like isoform X2 [Ostrea edulis]|uniref:ceramide kinase 1-like isoform X2 n=1 Tax=Ostrea edulis TaxID=37623 RepID=UPI0024AF7A7F|nr:ceramide kinase 1-like isoform X2 [Ostrea edulis]
MKYSLVVDGLQTEVVLDDGKLTFASSGVSYEFNDIIGCDEIMTGWFRKKEVARVWLIERDPSNLMIKKSKVISGDQRKGFQHDLTEKLRKETKRPKQVLVLINPIGGNGTARKDFINIVEPLFKLSGISMDIVLSERPGHMIDVAKTYDFTNTDGVVLLGGDGSYHEVVNVLMRKRQEEQGVDINDQNSSLSPLNIPIAMIPTGTGNGVSENNTGSKDVLTAALHVVKGRTVSSHLLALYSNGSLLGFGGTASTYGFMTDLLFYADRKFRWLGRSRYLFVPMWMLLFKSHTNRVYNAKVTYYTNVTERCNSETSETEIYVEDRKLSGYSSFTSDTVVFNRKFWNMMTLNGNVIYDGNVKIDVPRMFIPKPTMCSSFLFYDSVALGSVFTFFKHIRKRTAMDVPSNELEVLNIQGFNVELTDGIDDEDPNMMMLKRLVQLDGEMFELKAPSFQLRYKLDVVQIFSSHL